MSEQHRGEIRHRDRMKQVIDFHGFQFGSITPTDLDGVFEYHGKAYVFFEVKYRDAQMPTGQRLCLERLVADVRSAGKQAVAILLEHGVDNPEAPVTAKDCTARAYFADPARGWVTPSKSITAYELARRFIDHIDGEHGRHDDGLCGFLQNAGPQQAPAHPAGATDPARAGHGR